MAKQPISMIGKENLQEEEIDEMREGMIDLIIEGIADPISKGMRSVITSMRIDLMLSLQRSMITNGMTNRSTREAMEIARMDIIATSSISDLWMM